MNLSSYLVKRVINLPITSRIVAGITPSTFLFSTDKPNNFKFIKRPNTAYIIYVNEKRKELVEKNKNAKVTEIVSKLAEQWRSLDLNDKKVYYQKSEEESKKYKETLNKMPDLDEYLQKRHEYLVSRRKKLARFRDKKERRELNEPKQPTGPFGLYIQTLDRGNALATEFIKGAAEKWKQLPEEEKQKFRKEFKEKSAAYEKEKFAWESEMIVKGKENLVRKRSLGKIVKSVHKLEEKQAGDKKLLKKTAAKKKEKKKEAESKSKAAESESDSDTDEKAKNVFK